MINQQQLSALNSYFASQPVEAAYLFGSQASGKANRLSDVDVAVLFQDKLKQKQRNKLRMTMIGDIGHILARNDTEVVDLKELPLSFNYQAIASKKMLYLRPGGRAGTYEARIIKHYLDIKPALQMIAKRQLEITSQKGLADD